VNLHPEHKMNMDSKKMVAPDAAASTETKSKPTSTTDETVLAKVGAKFKLINVTRRRPP